MENFLPRENYFDVFVPPPGLKVGFGREYLVGHVRAGEILDDTSPDYPLTPVEFYADPVAETGLKPVFMGQTAPNAYTDRIRERFPEALFLDTQDIVADFETIRRSKNVVVGIGTFAWLAAWLSTEAENIFMAVNGLMNPMQRPIVDLLPYGDTRFRCYLFPINYAVNLDRVEAVHRSIAPYWRHVTHTALKTQVENAPRFGRSLDEHLAVFEVSQGDCADFCHHYLAVGKAGGIGRCRRVRRRLAGVDGLSCSCHGNDDLFVAGNVAWRTLELLRIRSAGWSLVVPAKELARGAAHGPSGRPARNGLRTSSRSRAR